MAEAMLVSVAVDLHERIIAVTTSKSAHLRMRVPPYASLCLHKMRLQRGVGKNVLANMNRAVIFLLTTALVACATNDQPAYPPPRSSAPPPTSQMRSVAYGIELMPADDWWHQPMIADAVRLTSDQVVSLDRLASGQDEITRLEHDMVVAMRDV